MCGIAGIVTFDGSPVDAAVLKKMADSLAHRGPDGEGFWINDGRNVGFGHRRLAIIDLSEGGRQPMHYADGRYTITHNGEIYNYIELRDRLKLNGYVFKTESDTEVLLAIYDWKKEHCLSMLDGMFSFAIWDEKEQTLFCARDRFGEKPFHYYYDEKRFVFGSEIKALFKKGIEKKINYKNLQNYLDHGSIELVTDTFFHNIQKLQQAHYLIIKNGTLSIHNYYTLSIDSKIILKNDEEYAGRFRELFLVSLKRRLRSEVPVGTSLSGGLDSSTIVCFIDQLLGHDKMQKTFSARFDDPEKDEGKWIDMVVKKAKTDHYEIFPDPAEFAHEINKINYHHEYPLGSTSNYAHFYVLKLAKEKGITVILDGQGADEILAGYDFYRQYAMWEMFYSGKFGKLKRERNLQQQIHGRKVPVGYLFVLKALMSRLFFPGNIDNSMYRSLKAKLRFDLTISIGELLAYADRNSMAHGVETRLPFLYHELVEFALALPNEQIYRNATTKWVLRNAIKNVVPDEIVNRRDKLGYAPPQEKWMKYLKIPADISLEKEGLHISKNYWRNYSAVRFLETFK